MVSRIINVEWTSTGASRVTKAMSDVEQQASRTAATTTTAGTKINTTFQKVAGAGGGIRGLTSGLADLVPATAVTGAALYGVSKAFESVISAGREQERANRLTQAVLNSTGGVAGVTAGHVQDLASSLSKVSGVQDDVIQSGENVLLTFTAVRNEVGKGNDVFDQASKAALDMSAALGTDLQGNIIRVGKALQDPVAGLTALRRVGVNVSELSKRVKELVANGDKLGAQKAILKELATEFGGAAAAAADPLDKLNVRVKELKESLGTALLPSIDRGANALSFLSDKVGEANDRVGNLPGFGVFKNTLENTLIPGHGVLDLFDKVSSKGKDAASVTQRLADTQKTLADDIASGSASKQQLADDTAAVTAAQKEADRVARGLTAATTSEADAQKKAADATKEHANALNTLFDAENAVLGGANSLARAELSVQTAMQDEDAAALKVLATHGQNRDANQALTSSNLSLKDSVLSAAQAAATQAQNAEKLRQAQTGENDAVKVATAGHRAELAELNRLEAKFPQLTAVIEGYKATLKGIPTEIVTTLTVKGGLTPAITTSSGGSHPGSGPDRRASGGTVNLGKAYLVGENGPELFVPKQSGEIVSHAVLAQSKAVSGVSSPPATQHEKDVRAALEYVSAVEKSIRAQDDAKLSVLNLRDANRQLIDALHAQKIAGREAAEALGDSVRSVASAKLDLQDAKANLKDAQEGGDREEIARAKIAVGDAKARLREAREAVQEARRNKAEVGKKNSRVDDDVKRARIGVTEAGLDAGRFPRSVVNMTINVTGGEGLRREVVKVLREESRKNGFIAGVRTG